MRERWHSQTVRGVVGISLILKVCLSADVAVTFQVGDAFYQPSPSIFQTKYDLRLDLRPPGQLQRAYGLRTVAEIVRLASSTAGCFYDL